VSEKHKARLIARMLLNKGGDNYENIAMWCRKAGWRREARRYYQKAADEDFARGVYSNAIEFYQKAGNPGGVRKVNNAIGDAALRDGSYYRAIDYYGKAGNTGRMREAHKKLGQREMSRGHHDEALKHFKKARYTPGILELARRNMYRGNEKRAIAMFMTAGWSKKRALLAVSEEYFHRGLLEDSARYYRRAGCRRCMKKIAAAYLEKDEYEKAYKIYSQLGHKKEAGLALDKLMEKCTETGDVKTALYCIKKHRVPREILIKHLIRLLARIKNADFINRKVVIDRLNRSDRNWYHRAPREIREVFSTIRKIEKMCLNSRLPALKRASERNRYNKYMSEMFRALGEGDTRAARYYKNRAAALPAGEKKRGVSLRTSLSNGVAKMKKKLEPLLEKISFEYDYLIEDTLVECGVRD